MYCLLVIVVGAFAWPILLFTAVAFWNPRGRITPSASCSHW